MEPQTTEPDEDGRAANASGAGLAVGVLAALSLGSGGVGLGLTGIVAAQWADELALLPALRNEWALEQYPIWVAGGLAGDLAAVACGVALLLRGPQVKAAALCLAQLGLVSAFAGACASAAVSAQFEDMGLYVADALLRGLAGALLPALVTVAALRDDVTRHLSGDAAPCPGGSDAEDPSGA